MSEVEHQIQEMELFWKLFLYVIFILPAYDAVPVKKSNEIESPEYKNHHNLASGLSSLSRVLTNPISTTSPSTTSTTAYTTTSNSAPVLHYSCAMCGKTFTSIEDVKNHYVNRHNANPTAIHSTRRKFYKFFQS